MAHIWDRLQRYFNPGYNLPPLFGATEEEKSLNRVRRNSTDDSATVDSDEEPGTTAVQSVLDSMKKLRVSRTMRLLSLVGEIYMMQPKSSEQPQESKDHQL